MDRAYILDKARLWRKKTQGQDLEEAVQEAGIHLYYRDDFQDLLGMYTVVLKRRCIFLRSDLDTWTKRLVLAHELGHDLLHRDQAEEACFQEYHLAQTSSPMEYEANTFAAFLLIPPQDLVPALEEDPVLGRLAVRFGVPQDLMALRLNEDPSLEVDPAILDRPPGDFLKGLDS